MIVVDASAALEALLTDGAARRTLAAHQLHAPHLVDVEVASALRRTVAARKIDAGAAASALGTWRSLGLTRYPMVGLLDRIWALRDNVSSYDACYVALAESLDCALLTADAKLSRAPDLHCAITVIPC